MKITKEQLEQAIFDDKLKYSQIAEKYNMSVQAVSWYVNKYDVQTPLKTKKYPTKDELVELYFNQCKSVSEILDIYRMGKSTLEKLFKKYDLKFRPPGTNGRHRWTYDEVKRYFSDNGCELLSSEYVNQKTPLNYRCSNGHETKIVFSAFLRGQRCKKCATEKLAEKKKYTFEEVQKIFSGRGAVLLSTEYKGAHEKLEYICPKCGERAFMSLSNFMRGYGCSNCKRLRFIGKNNPHYNPDLTDDERLELGRYEDGYKSFRRSVFARDKKCVICGSTRNKIVHHLDGYSRKPEKRTDKENAVTLCEECHKKFHKKYGYGNNTKSQFEEFKIDNKKSNIK